MAKSSFDERRVNLRPQTLILALTLYCLKFESLGQQIKAGKGMACV